MKRSDVLPLLAVFALALALRAYDIAHPPLPFADEAGHVPAATSYWERGQFAPDFWEHPPLRHVLLYGFLRLLGDNPYGWRSRNVLFGALAAALTYLFALEIGGRRKAALLAGLLVATDPLHVVMSRFTWDEIYGGAFFLASVWLYASHRRRSLPFVLAAVLMGLALATKWYYVPAWLLVPFLALGNAQDRRDPATALFVATTWLLVPMTVYALSYYPWFGRGYTVPELLEHVVNSYVSLQATTFTPKLVFMQHPSSLDWFTVPIVTGEGTYLDQGRGEFVILMNSWPTWVLALPASIGMAIFAARRKTLAWALPPVFFAATWSIFLFVDRPAFVYSAAPLLPFAFTSIALAVTKLADRLGPRLYYAVAMGAIAWNLYLYPLVTAKRVPVALYRFLLSGGGIHFL